MCSLGGAAGIVIVHVGGQGQSAFRCSTSSTSTSANNDQAALKLLSWRVWAILLGSVGAVMHCLLVDRIKLGPGAMGAVARLPGLLGGKLLARLRLCVSNKERLVAGAHVRKIGAYIMELQQTGNNGTAANEQLLTASTPDSG